MQTMSDNPNASNASAAEKRVSYSPKTEYDQKFFIIPSVISERKRPYGDDIFKFFNIKNNQKYIPWKGSRSSLYMHQEYIKTYHLFNSLITDNNNIPVSVGNPLSMNHQSFCKLLQQDYKKNPDHFLFQEQIEGTEITLFAYKGNWHFASKYKFADKKTIDLFIDVAEAVGLKPKHLDENYCYNFVLQHPKYVYVHRYMKPAIYLISAFSVNQNKNIITRVLNIDLPGVLTPESVYMNFNKLDLVLREWKGKLPVPILQSELYKDKHIKHPHYYRGICITHLPTGLTTTATNYAFNNFQRKTDGCRCDDDKCSCSIKHSAISGNIANAIVCNTTCYDCKFSSYICNTCSERRREMTEFDDDVDKPDHYDDDDYDDDDDELEYASSCRCMTCRRDALDR